MFVRKGCGFGYELLDVGDSDMREDIMIVRLEYVYNGKREYLYVCICYMTVEDTFAQVENRSKYDILKRFVSQ